MAKLSLWLLTLAKDKPFEFLDHATDDTSPAGMPDGSEPYAELLYDERGLPK